MVNPLRVEDDFQGRIEATMAAAGWDVPLWLPTTAEDPGSGAATAAIEAGVDLICICGGDGTVMVVISAVAGSSVPVALIPVGTGNLLARNLGLPLDIDAALRVAVDGVDRQLDVGRSGDRAFAVMAGLGFDAKMLAQAPEGAKRRLGWFAYVLSGLRNLGGRRLSAVIWLDDREPMPRRVRTVMVGNVGTLQGGLPLLPDAVPDDGLLDVAIVAPRTLAHWLSLLVHLLRLRRKDAPGRLERYQARSIRVLLERSVARQLDGELIENGRELNVQVDPGALIVRVPTPDPVE
ncbi:MAG: NAD(+)/NADH kinase [Pseudonocardia sp.]|nr:NAD(+)/NADH kinase [Pseudonocardia sp.]